MTRFRRFVPARLRAVVRRGRDLAGNGALAWMARSPRAASFYYGLLSSAFGREHRAVAAGRLQHRLERRSDRSSVYLLRRNIHRLEKGLTMRPRRPVFAVEYIDETVECFARQVSGIPDAAEGELREIDWARDVLSQYFEVVGAHPRIDGARARFRTAVSGACHGVTRLGPFQRDLADPPPVSADDLLRLAQRRRSVRWFLPEPVPRAAIDRAIEVAMQSPSACNRQPYHFRVFDDPARVAAIASLPPGTAGYAANIPVLAVLIGFQRAYFSERDRHVIYIDASLAAMSFILALESMGLASCCINWPDLEGPERAMAQALGLEPDERVVMLIGLGYPDPDAHVPRSAKRAIDLVRSYNVPPT